MVEMKAPSTKKKKKLIVILCGSKNFEKEYPCKLVKFTPEKMKTVRKDQGRITKHQI